VLGARYVRADKLAVEPGDLGIELLAAGEDPPLSRRRRRELRPARSRGEVLVRLSVADALHRPLDAHLPPERVPVEEQGRMRVRVQLAALAAAVAGVEGEPVLVGALQQHHADRRRPSALGGGQRHCVGSPDPRRLGLGVPAAELVQRVCRHA